jgi:hypothetical protein
MRGLHFFRSDRCINYKKPILKKCCNQWYRCYPDTIGGDYIPKIFACCDLTDEWFLSMPWKGINSSSKCGQSCKTNSHNR